jgi:hypothetical protein
MMKRIMFFVTAIVSLGLMAASPVGATSCNLSMNLPVHHGGDEFAVLLDFNSDRTSTVDIFFSVTLDQSVLYWDGSTFLTSRVPWVDNITIPPGLSFSDVPIFSVPNLPFGLPDYTIYGDFIWTFELRDSGTDATVARCSTPFRFTCEGGVVNTGQPFLSWLPGSVAITDISVPADPGFVGPFALALTFHNTGGVPVTFTVPAGLMFASSTKAFQNLLLVTDFVVTLSPGQTSIVILPLYCINAGLSIPEGIYTVGSLAPTNLMDIVNFLKTKNVDLIQSFSVQLELWRFTDECADSGSVIQSLRGILP